jgi:DNA-binding response OmpR family regulator
VDTVEDVDKIVGLEVGADDYITKPFNRREVVARVKALLRRAGGTAPPPVLQIGELWMDLEHRSITFHGQAIDLTPTEFDLLKMFMEHPGRPFSHQELIENGLRYAYAGFDFNLQYFPSLSLHQFGLEQASGGDDNLRQVLEQQVEQEQLLWLILLNFI